MLKKCVCMFVAFSMMIGMFAGMPVMQVSAETLTGLRTWYNWDEVSEITVTDESGNGMDATLSSKDVAIVDGRLPGQKAISLNGNNSSSFVSMPGGIVNYDAITISTWVNPSVLSTWSRVFDFGTGTTANMFLTVNAGSYPRFAITTNGAGGEQQMNATSPLPTNKWTHIAVTLSGSTGKLYINGSQVASNNNMTLTPSRLGNTNQNYIGKSQYNDLGFNGLVGDFRIYNRALTDDDIYLLYLDVISDEKCVELDLDAINIGNVNAISTNLTLPETGLNGSTITWESSDPSIIEPNGTVHCPEVGQPDANVILTATVKKGEVTDIRVFECVVLAKLSDEQKIESLFINEVMSANSTTIRDGDVDDPEYGSQGGAFSDWIEIYNSSDRAIDLTQFTIADSSSTWTIPGGGVPGKGYLVIWASDKNKVAKDGQMHTNFAISKSGEKITLGAPNGTVVDTVNVIALASDMAYGRTPDGAERWELLSKPTPKKANAGYLIAKPEFSHDAGFYTEAFELQLSSGEEGAKVYYTTDGSEPILGSNSTLEYTDGILIKSRVGEANVLSNISTAEAWRTPKGEVFKGTTIRAVTVGQNGEKSEVVTHSYFVDSNMNTKYDLPVISIVTDAKNFFDSKIGIYTKDNDGNSGGEWERAVHVEFFEQDGTLGFSQNAGVRIHGGATRNQPQKSLRLYAHSDYDTNEYFNYDIFPNLTKTATGEKLTSFRRLILRNSGNDWGSTMFRDAMAQSLISDWNLDTQAYRPSIVFLNGEYWGMHNIRERQDRFYISSHYDLDRDKVALLEVLLRSPEEAFEISEGTQQDADDYQNDVTKFLNNNPVSDQANYEYIKTKIDIDNFIDYQIANIYYANTDWPGNNVKLWRYNTDDGEYDPDAPYGQDGRWRWIVYDTDFGFGLSGGVTHNTLSFATNANAVGGDWPNPPWSTYLLRALLQNTSFRNEFINRFADRLNTSFDPAFVNQRIDEMKAGIESSIPDQINRWQGSIGSINNWNNNIQVMKNFAQGRSGNVRQHIINKFSANGVTGTSSVRLNTNLEQGHIKINAVDIEPTTSGVTSASNWTGTYFRGVPITIKAIPKTGYIFDHWEGVAVDDKTSDILTLTLESDMNITAHFVQSDIVPPVLTLEGIPGVGVKLGDTYVDAGATATDDVDGDITSIITVDGNVDTNKAGIYILTYRVSDTAGNAAVEVKRTVVVANLSPKPYDLSQGTYSFTNWNPESSEGMYPENMIFLQTDLSDTRLEDEMTAPYCNVDALAYNNTKRTRINGLGEDGVAFINTGRDADLGAAVLALDATGMKNVKVSWTAGTVLPNSRTYAFILQYRVGNTGSFSNVVNSGEIVQYIRNDTAGHSQSFSDIALPEEVNNQPHVELRWKYYMTEDSATSGARAQLRLDDIYVTAESEEQRESDYLINVTFNSDRLIGGKLLNAIVDVTNQKGNDPAVMAIVALYDGKNSMVNVSYISKEIAIGQTESLSGGFKLPENTEGYKVSVFVWDGTSISNSSMKPLSEYVTIQ